jgi:hypothetical protein
MQVNATTHDGSRIRVRLGHEDAYVATAVPLAACVIQLLEPSSAPQTGLHFMGHSLETDRFLKDVKSMGLNVTTGRDLISPRSLPMETGDADRPDQ